MPRQFDHVAAQLADGDRERRSSPE
jgi:hypothetical protein